MPYTTIEEPRGFSFVFSGVVTESEIWTASDSMWGFKNWDELRFQIWDFLDAERLDLTETGASKYAYMDRAASMSSPRMKVAFIATAPEIIQVCQTYIDKLDVPEWEAQVFQDPAVAAEWAKPGI